MYFLIQKCNPIWHLDSTGNVLQSINGQKSSYLYSIVSHDPINKKNIPIFEWISTSHTQTTISSYLFLIKEQCLLYKKLAGKKVLFPFAPIIVTDFSFALINSILKIFNNCSMEEYLQKTFDIIIKKSTPPSFFKTMIYLCSTHFLHNFIKKTKKLTVIKDSLHLIQTKDRKFKAIENRKLQKGKKALIYSFTLLQNATSIEEFNIYLENIYILFNQPKQTESFFQAKTYIERIIINRNLKFDINFATTPLERERALNFSSLKNKSSKENNKKDKKSYKLNSPFTSYFESLINEFSCKIKSDATKLPVSKAPNIYYRPDMFKLIKNQLYLVPVWTGIFIAKHFNENKGTK